MAKRKQRGIAEDKTIRLPIAEGIDYQLSVEDHEIYREYLNTQIACHPELFLEGIDQGDWFHGRIESSRQHLKTRRIYLPRLKNRECSDFCVNPDF